MAYSNLPGQTTQNLGTEFLPPRKHINQKQSQALIRTSSMRLNMAATLECTYNTVARSPNVCTSAAILTAWYRR